MEFLVKKVILLVACSVTTRSVKYKTCVGWGLHSLARLTLFSVFAIYFILLSFILSFLSFQ